MIVVGHLFVVAVVVLNSEIVLDQHIEVQLRKVHEWNLNLHHLAVVVVVVVLVDNNDPFDFVVVVVID